ncbi:hypothetical protein E2553_40020 [Paraburkholderia dipogonis]|uniref:Uncharacterized protein n=1 Tax=Paraburkholderia dipogonis TaxID=1211383 RepID=A0A4Y8MJH9_9BURK|nr:hypothetical protein [Paraburkholderia dipogonis]TFE37609.1 hypothetical protein E2553_40020 [Paraburkholderia dipogonis]
MTADAMPAGKPYRAACSASSTTGGRSAALQGNADRAPGQFDSGVADTASNEPDEATKRKCQRVGALAYKIAAARNAGVNAATTFTEILGDTGNEINPPTVLALVKQLYGGFAKNMTPDGAAPAYYADCLVTADAKSIDGQSNIAAALAPFKTYTGEPLQKLLARQHIKVESIMVQAVKNLRVGDEKGDEIYLLVLRGRSPKSAPCGMHDFSQVDENVSEVIRRGPVFHQNKPTDLDLVMYWAATGKCNPEYRR